MLALPGRKRAQYSVPDHEGTLFAIAADPELSYTQVAIYNKVDISVLETEADYRQLLANRLFNQMINARFAETARSVNPPFLAAGSGRSNLIRTKGIAYVAAAVERNAVPPALAALAGELRRVDKCGFHETEIERARREKKAVDVEKGK